MNADYTDSEWASFPPTHGSHPSSCQSSSVTVPWGEAAATQAQANTTCALNILVTECRKDKTPWWKKMRIHKTEVISEIEVCNMIEKEFPAMALQFILWMDENIDNLSKNQEEMKSYIAKTKISWKVSILD